MSTESVEENIKNWVSIDNKIKKLNDEIKELKENKKKYEDVIQVWGEEQKDKGLKPMVRISDGKLRFVETKQTSPLTLKYIENCLKELFNETNANAILEYIKKNRETKIISEVKRSYDKNT